MRKLKKTVITLVTLFYLPAFSQFFCDEVFVIPENQLVSPKFKQYLKATSFPEISIQSITNIEKFGADHPDRSHGYQSKDILKGTYQGQTVLLKKATLTEVRFSQLLSDLEIGPKFYGTLPGGDYYVMQFLPESLLVKDPYIDHRLKRFKKNGFQLPPHSFLEIQKILKILAKLSIEPDDAQFLVQRSGQIKIIDPEFFRVTNLSSSEKYRLALERDFQNQIKKIESQLRN